jgi:hypothetical protein
VADQSSGIDLMRRRMERASRRTPPPRRAPQAAEAPAAVGGAPEAPARPSATRRPAPAPVRLAPDLPPANLAIRVRKPLDDRLVDLIHALRRQGVRTSKVELIEMLLWELPADDAVGARERLARFRAHAPRGPGAPLDQDGP